MVNSRSNNGEEYAEKGAPKRRSPVWNHFTLNKVIKRAICNHCKEDLQGDSKQGTNHLKRHLEKKHPDEFVRTDFQSSIKKITAEDTNAFRREELVSSVERNTESVAPRCGEKKRVPLSGEERKDDHLVEKRARLNKEKQLKRPSEESGLISQGNILIGEKNNITVQLPVQLGQQNQNGSTLELGGAFKNFVTEYEQLIEQKHLQEAKIKELKEALDCAKAEISEEKEARVAAEQKASFLTDELNALCIEKSQIKDALDRAKEETREETNLMVAVAQRLSVLIKERNALFNEKSQIKEELDRAKAEIRVEKEARVAAEQKKSVLTEEERNTFFNEKSQIKEALDHAKDSAKADIREEEEARVASELRNDEKANPYFLDLSYEWLRLLPPLIEPLKPFSPQSTPCSRVTHTH